MKQYALVALLTLVMGFSSARAENPIKAGANLTIVTSSNMSDGNPAYGVQGEIGLFKHLGIEFGYTTGLEMNDISLFDKLGSPGLMNVNDTAITCSAVFRTPVSEKIEAYGLTGISYDNFSAEGRSTSDLTSPDYINIKASDSIGFQLGGGFDLALRDNLELFIEYRHVFTTLDTTVTTPRLGGGTDIISPSYDMDYGFVKIGLNYLF